MTIPLSYEFRNDEELLPPRPEEGEPITFPIHPDSYTRLMRLDFEMSLPTMDAAIRKALEAERRNIIKRGVQYSNQQSEFAGKRHEESHKKHVEWQKWQAEAIAENPRFSEKSKLEQAKLLKQKHSIAYAVGTISKRLK